MKHSNKFLIWNLFFRILQEICCDLLVVITKGKIISILYKIFRRIFQIDIAIYR